MKQSVMSKMVSSPNGFNGRHSRIAAIRGIFPKYLGGNYFGRGSCWYLGCVPLIRVDRSQALGRCLAGLAFGASLRNPKEV